MKLSHSTLQQPYEVEEGTTKKKLLHLFLCQDVLIKKHRTREWIWEEPALKNISCKILYYLTFIKLFQNYKNSDIKNCNFEIVKYL